MREGLDEKLDLWLEIGHFQVFPIDRFLPDKSCTLALSCGFGSPIRVCFNEACAKGDRRAWHGGYFAREQCMWTHVCRRSHRSAPLRAVGFGWRSCDCVCKRVSAGIVHVQSSPHAMRGDHFSGVLH